MIGTENDGAGDYRVFGLPGRPVLAIPAEPLRLRLAGLSRYHPVTKKRAVLRAALRLAMVGGLDVFLSRREHSPIKAGQGFDFPSWLARVRGKLNAPDASAAIVWPQRAKRKRIYAHLMTPAGAAIAFCKISLDAANDRRLRDEVRALAEISRLDLCLASLPHVLGRGRFMGRHYVAYEPLPEDMTVVRGSWSELAPMAREFSGVVRRISRTELERLSWWRRFVSGRDSYGADFLHAVDAAADRGARVCRVQGDLTPANVFQSAQRIWICDWEHSSSAGPVRTDEVSYCLAMNHYRCLLQPATILRILLARLEHEGGGETTGEVALALAFLASRGDPRARSLAGAWKVSSSRSRLVVIPAR